MSHPAPAAGRPILALLLVALLAPWAASCDGGDTTTTPAPAGNDAAPPPPDPDALTLVFPYGSEKKQWLTEATARFNAAGHTSESGKPIRVDARPMGSGETMTEVLEGRLQAHLVSPASAAFVELANADSRARTGGDLVGPTRNLVLSPVVIAMWRPMAEALGWPGEPIGWADVLDLGLNEQGWAAHGHPEWGRFKYGHTHPEYSNSGLISVLAEVYAAAGKQRGLTLDDLARPDVGEFVGEIESAVVHYGSSTGFFGDKMFARGPGYLSAAVLYENMVIESYDRDKHPDLPLPVVAIYPKEGTFWSDHPAAVVNRPWVTDEHRAAADLYVAYLLEPDQQAAALRYGFRPGDPAVPLASPVDAAHGVNPAEPRTTLQVPPAEVVQASIDLWRVRKKPAEIALVLDVSGSMKGERIANAKVGAQQLVDLLNDADRLTVVPFNDDPTFAVTDAAIGQGGRARASSAVGGLFADGGTALYDAIAEAHAHLARRSASADAIAAVVVLSDGEDTQSDRTLEQLLSSIKAGDETRTVRVFTIRYGEEAERAVLKRIADETDGKSYDGTPENIREVFKDIATFF